MTQGDIRGWTEEGRPREWAGKERKPPHPQATHDIGHVSTWGEWEGGRVYHQRREVNGRTNRIALNFHACKKDTGDMKVELPRFWHARRSPLTGRRIVKPTQKADSQTRNLGASARLRMA